ncbi:putative myosin light chain kinase [Porphyridium purpureum]|uniref:Putative myosin light chain kinase n=1 Tax=Porphyridium purpureum TaxID=35688 RepID=A0A5J4YQM1_PORPP|nr:putative myosin light chain kinase [Porphyridium purpureum]|eukprot:POR3478..scf236_6
MCYEAFESHVMNFCEAYVLVEEKRGRFPVLKKQRLVRVQHTILSCAKDADSPPLWSVDVSEAIITGLDPDVVLVEVPDQMEVRVVCGSRDVQLKFLQSLELANRRQFAAEYSMGDQIGSGKYGDVFLCTQVVSGKQFAVKRIGKRPNLSAHEAGLLPPGRMVSQISSPKGTSHGSGGLQAPGHSDPLPPLGDSMRIRLELDRMRSAQHPNLAELVYFFAEPRALYFVYELGTDRNILNALFRRMGTEITHEDDTDALEQRLTPLEATLSGASNRLDREARLPSKAETPKSCADQQPMARHMSKVSSEASIERSRRRTQTKPLGGPRGFSSFSADSRTHSGACEPSEALLSKWFTQIFSALAYLHERGCVHGNIHPMNIHVSGDRVFLGEFNMLQLLDNFECLKLKDPLRKLGNKAFDLPDPRYCAPEFFRFDLRERATPAADMWSVGVVLNQLLTGAMPFPGRTHAEVNGMVLAKRRNMQGLEGVSPGALELLDNLLVGHPAQRWSAAQCLESQWIRSPGNLYEFKIAQGGVLLGTALPDRITTDDMVVRDCESPPDRFVLSNLNYTRTAENHRQIHSNRTKQFYRGDSASSRMPAVASRTVNFKPEEKVGEEPLATISPKRSDTAPNPELRSSRGGLRKSNGLRQSRLSLRASRLTKSSLDGVKRAFSMPWGSAS